MQMKTVFVVISLCTVAVANPVPPPKNNKCAAECSGTSSKFRYEAGKAYNYRYETETKVKLAGVSEHDASVKVEANAQISVIAPCEFSLKLDQVKITGPTTADLGSDWTQELQKHVTRFSFDDGEVGEICPKDEEPTWSVNIKRAILSAFQNGQTSRTDAIETYEEDVSGRCPTKFEIRQEGDATVVTKTKNLVSCFNRWGNNTAARFVPYEVRSAIQGNPAIDSKQTCNQTIRSGILADTICEEKHILKRYNNGDKGGVISTAAQKLHFLNENGNVAQGDAGQPEKLYFDHKEIEHTDSKQALQDGRQNLKDLCKTNQDGVRPETPGLFNELVYNLRKLSVADLKTLYQESAQTGGCGHAKDCFLNALPMCADTACVSLMADILKTEYNQLTYIQTRVYFTSLALIPHVNKEMIAAVTPLIDTVPKEGLLGISSLVHTYCRENPSCGDHPEVKAVVQKLTAPLGTKCEAPNDEARDTILYSLKALGNIGHSLESVDMRVNCLKERANPSEIRLAAIHSLRRTPCSARVVPLKERFADANEDIEVRLSSFLAFIPCATPAIVNEVKEILEKEEIHQVGSFVRTYFEQIGSSSDPCKLEIHNLLSSQHISKKFNNDPRKYSRFYETSQFSNEWNFGAHAEHALIFTPEGYLPRQGFLNLTLDAFGSSVNLLQIGGRVEGLETLLDKLFGPNGYFTNPTAFYFQQGVKPPSNPRVAELQQKFGSGIKKHPNLDLSMFVRIFGDEIAYKSIRDFNVMESYAQIMQKITSTLRTGQEANVKLVRANQLINHYASMPTVSGLPLHMAVNGTIAVNVEFTGKVDLSRLRTEKNAEIRASLKPSAAVERSFIFGIHVGQSKFGVRMQERVHSSTAANIAMELKNGELFKSSLELPKQKNEILQYDVKLFTIKNNVPIEEPGIQKDRVQGQICTPDRLNNWIGFKICHEAAFPNATSVPDAPYFPLTGPVRYAMILEKTDPNLKAYEFTATWKNIPGARTAKFSFNTPGSSIDREISLDYDYQRSKSLAVNFKSPLKKINAVGTLEAAGEKQNGRIQIKVDDSKEYTLVGSHEMQRTATGQRVTCKGEITRPGQRPITLSSLDNYELPQSGLFKRTFDLNVVNLYDTPVEFKSAVERTGQREGKIEFTLKSPKLNAKVSGNISLDGTIGPVAVFRLQPGTSKSVFDWDIEYQRPNVDSEPHKVEAKYGLEYAKEQAVFKMEETFVMKSSKYPTYNADYKLKVIKTPQQLDLQAQVKDGTGRDCALTIASTNNAAENKVAGTAALKSARFGLDHKAEFSYQNHPNQFACSVKLDTPETKDIRGELKYSRTPGAAASGEAKVSYPGREFRIFKKMERAGANKYKSQVILQWERDKQLQLDSDITFDQRAKDYEFKTVATGLAAKPWVLHKKVKIGDDLSIKSSALFQTDSATVYDWKLDIAREGPNKQKLQAQFLSEYRGNKIDVSTDGSIEDMGFARKVNFMSKKDQKDFLKGELVIPNIGSREPRKQVKVDLSWGRNALLLDHQATYGASDQIQIDTAFKLDLPESRPPINKKLSVNITKNAVKIVNISLFDNNKQVLEAGFSWYLDAQLHGISTKFDAALKTFEPSPTRHLTAFGVLKLQRDVEIALQAENVQEKRRLGMKYSRKPVSGTQQIIEAESYFNERYIKSKQTYERIEQESLSKLSGEIEFNNGGVKKIVHAWSCKTGPVSKATMKLQTPFASLADFDGRVETSVQGPQRKHNVELKWNQNQNIKLEVTSDETPGGVNLDASLQSTLALKKAQFALKSDLQAGRDFEAKLDWNEANKVRLFHKRTSQPSGDESWSSGIESVIPNTANCKASVSADWNANTGKYKAGTEAQLNEGNAYKAQAAFDSRSQEGTVDITTPADQLKNMKAQVKKISENEYELKVVQDAQTVADVKATLLLEQHKQKVSLEVKNIQKPFKTQIEREFSPLRSVIGGEFNAEPQDPKKGYGIKFVSDRPSPDSCDIQASLSYPLRQLGVHYKRKGIAVPGPFEASLELQANAGEPGTNISVDILSPGPGQAKVGLHIIKERGEGETELHLEGSFQMVGNCKPGVLEACSISGDITGRYSLDPNKTVSHKFKFNRELVEQRPKHSYEWQSQHPATGIQIKHYAAVLLAGCPQGRPECKRTIDAGIELLDKQKQAKVYKYKYETDSYRTASAELSCPSGKLSRQLSWDGEKLRINIKRDDKNSYELTAGYDRPDKEFKLEVKDSATSEVIIHAGARKPSVDTVEFQLWHSESKKKVEDVSVIIALKENSRVRSRLFVRPGFKDDFGNYLKSQMGRVTSTIQGGAASGESPFAHLVQARQALHQDISTNLKPLFDHWQKQLGAIGRELNIDLSDLRNLCVNLVTALRDILSTIQDYFTYVLTDLTSSTAGQTLRKLLEDVQEYLSGAILDAQLTIRSLGESVRPLADAISEIAAKWRKILDDLFKDLHIDQLKAYLKSIYDEMMQNPILRKIIEFLQKIGIGLPDLSWERVQASLANVNEQVGQAAGAAGRQVGQHVSSWWEQLLQNEDTKVIARFLQEAYNRLVWHLSRLGPSDKVRGFFQWLTQEFQDLTTGATVKRYLPSVKESMPEKGIYVVEGTIPGQFKSMDEIASAFEVNRLGLMAGTIRERLGSAAETADNAVKDALLYVHPSSTGVKLVSALSSTAVLVGDHRFITFDGEQYDFAGECEYLLARDFGSGVFTIFASFERRQNSVARKSVTVEYLDHKVEVSYDNKVKINGKEAELPWQSMNDETQDVTLFVIRHDNIVTITAVDGLVINCDSQYHFCAITVPKRFHGKSGGLLGTNDFEPYNEFTKPDRTRTKNVGEFAREWYTSQGCPVNNNQAVAAAVPPGSPLFEDCKSLLNSSSSPLRLCFHRLPPGPFMDMCLITATQQGGQQPRPGSRQNQGVCSAAAAYIEGCEEQGIALDFPSQCIQCEAVGAVLNEGDTKRLENNEVPNYADVIFVVEERNCMNWTRNQLPTIAQRVEADLRQQQYDVRFGLIGFNGEGVHYAPHFHTGQGAISLTGEALRYAVAQLAFSPRERRRFQDPLVAVKFAADHYQFRAGTRKLLALFACEECGGTEVDYLDLQSELLQMSVGLHMFTTQKIELSSPGSPEIIALDASTMYAADLSEKPELRSQLVGPHDSCTVLTQETNGTVFSHSDKHLAPLVHLLSRKLVSAVNVPKCQMCECQEHERIPRTVCFPCEIPRPASLTSDSTGFFNNPFVRLQKWQKKAHETINRGLATGARYRRRLRFI